MSSQLPLTNGGIAVVDSGDFDRCIQYPWWRTPSGYARNKAAKSFLHEFIIGKAPKGFEIDHANGDGLDCRKSNLRIATKSQNQANAGKYAKASSQFKGVSRRLDCWCAQLQFQKSKIALGYFSSEQDAAQAYDVAAHRRWGIFARLNFPQLLPYYESGAIAIHRLKRQFPLTPCRTCGRLFRPYTRKQLFCCFRCAKPSRLAASTKYRIHHRL